MSKLIDIKSIATPEQWNDWHWQIKNRITTHAQLSKYIELQPEEEAVFKNKVFSFRMAITRHYLSLIDHSNPYDPIRLRQIPRIAESHISPSDMASREDADVPVPGMTSLS